MTIHGHFLIVNKWLVLRYSEEYGLEYWKTQDGKLQPVPLYIKLFQAYIYIFIIDFFIYIALEWLQKNSLRLNTGYAPGCIHTILYTEVPAPHGPTAVQSQRHIDTYITYKSFGLLA